MKKKQLTIADLPKADLIRICQQFMDGLTAHGFDVKSYFDQRSIASTIYHDRYARAVRLNNRACDDYAKAKKIRGKKKRDIAMMAVYKKYFQAEKMFKAAKEFKALYGLNEQ